MGNRHIDNHKKNKDEIKKAFLAFLGDGYSITYAAKAAGISRPAVYCWRWADAKFASSWDDAYEQGTDWYEDRLREAALSLNPTMIIAALNARRPQIYKHPSKIEVGGTIKHAHHDMSRFTDEELDSLVELAQRQLGGAGETAAG